MPFITFQKLFDLLIIAICAVISGGGTWPEIYEYGMAKKAWFETFLQLPNGIPSANTFRRVFILIDKDQFENCFINWINGVETVTEGQVIAIDGKTDRGTYDRASGKSPIHVVSAWASENRITLENNFDGISYDFFSTVEGDHGRVGIRRYYTVSDIDWLFGQENWKNINMICMVESERHIGDQISIEHRYYISSVENDAEKVASSVRSHQGIENSVHQVLDIGFCKDESRKRKGNSAFNFSILRHIAMNLLRKEKTLSRGMRTKRLKAGWSDDYLTKVLTAA